MSLLFRGGSKSARSGSLRLAYAQLLVATDFIVVGWRQRYSSSMTGGPRRLSCRAIAKTIPVAFVMGIGLRAGKVNVMAVTIFGLLGLACGVWGGQFLAHFPAIEAWFRHDQKWLAWAIMIYGLAASVLPVWMLLTPRDYLSTFLKLGTVGMLAAAVVLINPTLQMPALTKFVDGTGLVFAGPVFPFVCITIACGAVSGFHSLIASGTTPKMIRRESRIRPIGYGAMVLEIK